MPTNDERREVAARLRDYIDLDFEDSNPYWYAMKAVYGDVAIHDDNELFSRLADLIEPEERTCEMVEIPDGWEDADGSLWPDCWVCDDCGTYTFGFMVQPDTMYRPNYCPRCGAPVRSVPS